MFKPVVFLTTEVENVNFQGIYFSQVYIIHFSSIYMAKKFDMNGH